MNDLSQNAPSANTPRGGVGSNPDIPRPYIVEEFIITNQAGQTYDIRALLLSFTITEELFSPIVVFNGRIRDNINFFQEFSLSGQEILKITLQQEEFEDKQYAQKTNRVELYFTVKEYPNYQKLASSLAIQEYNIVAVSEHAYLSLTQRISRSVHGDPTTNISKIFTKDLNVKDIVLPQSPHQCTTPFDGVIVIQSPLKAAEWLRTKCYDAQGAPFFVYTDIAEKKIKIESWSAIISRDAYPSNEFSYKYSMTINNEPADNTKVSTNSRILAMSSNIRLDKLVQATRGGFANKTQITDFSTKTFIEKIFNIDKDKQIQSNRLSRANANFKNSEWGEAFGFLSGKTNVKTNFASLPDASISQVSANSNTTNSSGVLQEQLGTIKSYLAGIDSESHEIEVYGDFSLNPGKRIRVEIPKAANISADQQIDSATGAELDESLSGDYVVAVAVHIFQNGTYTTKTKIIRDNS
jgi:hypothetical protein